MKPRFAPLSALGLALGLGSLSSVACSDVGAQIPASAAEASGSMSLADAALDPYRERLLDLAFESASAMPPMPHLKDRSRAQQDIVDLCLELDLPRRAHRYLERIENWRQGAAYADLAYYCALHGDLAPIEGLLHEADLVAERGEEVLKQAWRRDRIRVKIARTYLELGQVDKALEYGTGVEDSETGTLAAAQAKRFDAAEFDSEVEHLREGLDTRQLDALEGALRAAREMYRRFYENEERRERVAQLIEDACVNIPPTIRVETSGDLARCALEHDDPATALAHVANAEAVLQAFDWPVKDLIPRQAMLAELRFRAGDRETGRKHADDAFALFAAKWETILNGHRPNAIRPVAEAYLAMGNREAAEKAYRRAVKEGVVNPNARPRAEDLAETCCSMAKHGFEPDEELWGMLQAAFDGLDHPW